MNDLVPLPESKEVSSAEECVQKCPGGLDIPAWMGRYRSTCVDLSVGVLLIAVVWVPKFVGYLPCFVA